MKETVKKILNTISTFTLLTLPLLFILMIWIEDDILIRKFIVTDIILLCSSVIIYAIITFDKK